MRPSVLLIALSSFVFCACAQNQEDSISVQQDTTNSKSAVEFNPGGKTIEKRYNVPLGFIRVAADSGSFAHYLRNLPLKPADAEVKYYNGGTKSKGSVYKSVVDLPIGNKNLHQCADAVMRFRGEYLWSSGQHNDIHFNFTNGFRVDYSKWLAGNRMVVSGNKTYWSPGSPRTNNYNTFWKYMELIFNYAGTLSLEKELKPRAMPEIQIGDVFIQGGSPGHAVIVVDLCENPETGEKRFLLAQSYMPAQETQVLMNPGASESSWYSVNFEGSLYTPEWTFESGDLKRF